VPKPRRAVEQGVHASCRDVDGRSASRHPARNAGRDSSGQSFNAVRASPADARAATDVCPSAGSRLPGPRVAPRMNNTAHVAHIAQMPNITSHFSISPVLRNPVPFFYACPEGTCRHVPYIGAPTGSDKGKSKKNHAQGKY
jgi:hypothetical protein